MIKLTPLLKEVVTEALKNNTSKAIKDLLSKTDKVIAHSSPKRVKNVAKISPEEFKNLLHTTLEVPVKSIKIIPAPNHESGKFAIYNFPYQDGEANIVLAGEQRGGAEEEAQKTALGVQIKQALEEAGRAIKIKVGSKTYTIEKGEVIKVPGNAMADFAVDDKIFIQHKQEKFQQMSGFIITEQKGKIGEDAKKEMKQFVADVKKRVGNNMPSATGFKRKVQSSDLIKAAIFGSRTEEFGIHKVQLVCQGEVKLVKLGKNLYSIEGSTPGGTLNYFTETVPEKWHPYMIARYSGTKGHNQYGIQNCRFNFVTKDYYSAAKII